MKLEAHEEKVGFSNSNSSSSQPPQPDNFICSFMQLLELIKNISNTCQKCHSTLSIRKQHFKGLCLKLHLSCQCGSCSATWSSSPKLSNNSYFINQLVPVSALICGMGTKGTMELMELFDIGELSREHFRTVFNSFHEVVKKEKDKSLEQAIDHCNKKNNSSIIQVD
jgi:hypothetical protein